MGSADRCQDRELPPDQSDQSSQGTLYGFGFREHYLESEDQKKLVTIDSLTTLDTYLIELYQFYEQLGVGLSNLCSQW